MKPKGFSLVEVLIAASIVSVVAMSISQMQGASLYSMNQSRLMRQATDLSSAFMEELKAQPSQVPVLCNQRQLHGFDLSCSYSSLVGTPPIYNVRIQTSRNGHGYLDLQTIMAVQP